MAAAAALWPFIRELFFNRKAIFSFISRHRLSIALWLACTIMFLLLMFMTEQSIRQETRHADDTKTVQELKRNLDSLNGVKKDYDQCRDDLATAQENYRILSHAAPAAVTGPAAPLPDKRKDEGSSASEALPPRDYDVYIRKRLHAIDGE